MTPTVAASDALGRAVHDLWETEPTIGCYHRPDDGSGLCADHAAEFLAALSADKEGEK